MAELGYVAVSVCSNSPDLPVEFGNRITVPAAHMSHQLHIKCQASPEHHEVLGQAEANCPCLRCRKKLTPALTQSSRDSASCLGYQAGHRAAGAYWFAEGQEDLAPEDVEEVGWSGAVHNDPVTFIELTHIKVIQLLPRPAQVKRISANTRYLLALQLQQQEEEWSPTGPPTRPPSLSFPPSHRGEHTETCERLQGCALHLGLAMGVASNPLSCHFQGHLCLRLCHSQRFHGGPAWAPGSGPFPKPSGQHETKACHASCHWLPLC